MCDTDGTSNKKSFSIDKPKSSRAVCKICKKKCLLGEIRIAKYIPDIVGNGKKKNWHHVDCIFKQFQRQRLSTKRIKSADDLDGWKDLSETDRKVMQNKIKRSEEDMGKRNKKYDFKKLKKTKMKKNLSRKGTKKIKSDSTEHDSKCVLFKSFCDLANDLIERCSYIERFCTISKIFKQSSNIGIVTKNDLKLFCNLLFSDLTSRTISIQTKQLGKIFAKLFSIDCNDIINDTEIMHISDSISFYFTQSKKCKPANVNSLTLSEVDEFLDKLSNALKEDNAQVKHFDRFVGRCTVDELKILIRLIQNDLDTNICLKYLVEVIHPDAYQIFQKTKMFDRVIDEYVTLCDSKNSVNAKLSPMAIVLPVLAETCRPIDQALSKYPKGVFCDLNYEGERVHFHKKSSDFKYYPYSSEQPGCVEKITNLKSLVFEAFPYTSKLIIDCEILPFNTKTGNLLPPYNPRLPPCADVKHIIYCIVVIDCMFFDGDISRKPLRERRDILKRNMVQIPNLLILSQAKEVHCEEHMNELVAKMFRFNVDGLILKDMQGIYAPSQRQWLKIRRNSFVDVNTAVIVDLIVLGGWKDPNIDDDILSMFLMGCFDAEKKKFCTVTNVYTDKDDKYFENSAAKMNMIQVGCDDSSVPDWLCCSKNMLPEFLAKDPQSQPVLEITGLELIKDDSLSSAGISFRFPRITCTKENGKDRRQVIDLTTLRKLYEETKIDVLSVTKEESPRPKNAADEKNTAVKAKGNQKLKRKVKNAPGANSKKKIKKDQPLNNCKEAPAPSTEVTTPNYFKDVFLLLDEQVCSRHTQWIRSFVANGGTLVPDCLRNSATHVLHLYDEEPLEKMYRLKNAVHVIVEWIKDTLRKGSLQDDRPYRVRLVTKENDENIWRGEKPTHLSARTF